MAFEKLYDCIDEMFQLAERYKSNGRFKEEGVTIRCTMIYYQTVLSMPKFKSQREHFQQKLFKHDPSVFRGHFGVEYPGGPKIKPLYSVKS